MWVMFDSVNLDTVPASAQAVAGYTSGNWPTFPEVQRRWPHARHLSIAISARHDAECLDIEPGDSVPADAPGWLIRQEARGVHRPVVYGSESTLPQIFGALERARIARSRYRVWSAHYTFTPHVDDHADATQWTDKALGRNLDESLCRPSFFDIVPVGPSLGFLLEPELRLVNTLDHYRKHPHEHAHGIKVTLDAMVRARKLIWVAAVKGHDGHDEHGRPIPKGWGIRNRKARYDILWQRTGGRDHG